jgi:hypothetical protein
MVVHGYNPSYLGDGGRRISIREKPKPKNTYVKNRLKKSRRTRGMAQVVECLPST